MDVAFVKVVGAENYPGGLDALVKVHRVDDSGVNLGDHWKHKYIVDLDGMGYSGRFFSFMESDSVVLKHTVYREFYSDWIQPWYVITYMDHFTPQTHVRSAGCTTSLSRSPTPRSTTSTRSSPELRSPPYAWPMRLPYTCQRTSARPSTAIGG